MADKYNHITDIASFKALLKKRDDIIAGREKAACTEEKAALQAVILELEAFKEKYLALRMEVLALLEDGLSDE